MRLRPALLILTLALGLLAAPLAADAQLAEKVFRIGGQARPTLACAAYNFVPAGGI